jgi:hypothetical protein
VDRQNKINVRFESRVRDVSEEVHAWLCPLVLACLPASVTWLYLEQEGCIGLLAYAGQLDMQVR